MRKAIVFMPKLSVGGMEKAFINFIKFSDLTKLYKVDIILGYSENERYFKELKAQNANVNLVCKHKWNMFNKAISFVKLCFMNLIIKNKYDLSICYSHHHKILARLTKRASKNNCIFIHTDLINSRTPVELNKLLNNLKFDEFSYVVCVSNHVRKTFKKLYPNYGGDIIVANNYIDGDLIIEKSKNKAKRFNFTKTTFINLSRHEEEHKKISYIIDSTKKLLDENYDFDLLLLGDGSDHDYYVNLVKNYGIEKNVHFIGSKLNPYKYLKQSDALIIASAYEGYGIVLDEARVLNVPIITTDVADSKNIIEEGYGLLSKHSKESIYENMKYFLDNGFKIKSKFNYCKFNDNITKELNKIFKKEI